MNFKSILGLVLSALTLLSPSLFGVQMPEATTVGLTMLGVLIYGFFAKEPDALGGKSLLTTILGAIPAVIWVLVYIVGWVIPPDVQYSITYGIVLIVGIISKAPDLQSALDTLKGTRLNR